MDKSATVYAGKLLAHRNDGLYIWVVAPFSIQISKCKWAISIVSIENFIDRRMLYMHIGAKLDIAVCS